MCFLRDVIGSLDCKLVFWLARTKPFPPFFKGGSGGVTICNVGGERDHMGHTLYQQTNQPKLYTMFLLFPNHVTLIMKHN